MNLFHMDAQLEKEKENICQLRSTGSSRNSDNFPKKSAGGDFLHADLSSLV